MLELHMHTMVSRWRTARKVPIAHVSLNQFLISTGTSGKMNAEYLVLFIQSLAAAEKDCSLFVFVFSGCVCACVLECGIEGTGGTRCSLHQVNPR